MSYSDPEYLRFPIGPWQGRPSYSSDDMYYLIDRIRQLPGEYADKLANRSDDDLNRQYRPDSWTVLQLVHHVADTHLLHYLRLKHALTESDTKAVVGDVDAWASLDEAQTAPVAFSLTMLQGTHERLAWLAQTLTPTELALTYYHPIRQKHLSLADALSITVWHAEHHLAHIGLALKNH
ncbi:bacillithiol transferase BstA [Spirosoma luteolum]